MVEYFIRVGLLKPVWGLAVVKVDESAQLGMPVLAAFEGVLVMPHPHGCMDDAFGLAVGLRPVDLGELLADALLRAGLETLVGAVAGHDLLQPCPIGRGEGRRP